MLGLLKQFVDIAIFRARPQDLSGGMNTLWIAVAAALFTYVFASLPDGGLGLSMQRAIVDLASTALFLYGCLIFLKRTERFQQAFSAMAGSGAVINVIAAPLIYSAGGTTSLPELVELLFLFLSIWGLVLSAYIFRHTFEFSLAVSTLIALGYLMTLIQISRLFFVPAAG